MSAAQKRSLVFSRADKLALINAIQKKMVIWDPSHPMHANLQTINQAWREVAHQLKKDVTLCRESFKVLRENYRNYSKRVKLSGPDGDPLSSEEDIDVDLEFGERMSFLSDVCSRRKTHRTASKGSNRMSNNSSNHKAYESQSEAWSDNIEDNYLTDNGPSVQLPEVSIDEEEEKYSSILNMSVNNICKDEHQFQINSTSSIQPGAPRFDEDEQTSSSYSHARSHVNPDLLASMFVKMMKQQKALLAQQPSTLQYPEVYAFWDSIIKDIPPEALSEIKFEVTALLHNIYKKYKQ
ncbi:uncharacterized protein LOC135433201 [Drosophila montana]|uniref:uncharacterized protein LOC135433201 n=1 Tax=Drosophila montana TaxID=40370 RepID=UPI00313E4850